MDLWKLHRFVGFVKENYCNIFVHFDFVFLDTAFPGESKVYIENYVLFFLQKTRFSTSKAIPHFKNKVCSFGFQLHFIIKSI